MAKLKKTPTMCSECNNKTVCVPGQRCPLLPRQSNTGDGLQRPQDTTGGPVTVEGVFDYPPSVRYRYFMTPDQAERVKRALERPVFDGCGIGFEVVPVPEDQVEADPEAFADMVEVTVDWKNE